MKKRKAAAAAAITAAAAGMLANAAFSSPAELVPELVSEDQQTEEESASADESRQRGPAARVRAWVLSLPAWVRMLVAVPLWCVGWVLISAASVFWSGTAPLLETFLNWLCLAGLLLGVFTLSVKTAFPGMKVRRVLRPGNLFLLLGFSALLWAADLALPTVWNGYDLIARTVWRVGAACLLAFACCTELRRQGKRAARQEQPVLPSRRTAAQREAMRLADTVCGKE